MNKTNLAVFWGLFLTMAGGIALASTLGVIPSHAATIWTYVFAGVSLASGVIYLLSGVRNWGVLFPAGIFAALAFMLNLADRGYQNPSMAAPLFAAVGLPFVVALIIDWKKNWWAVFPIGQMTFLTLTVLFVERVRGEVIGAGLLFILAVGFLAIFMARRAAWAVAAAYTLFILGLAPLLSLAMRPELFGPIFLFGLALPLLYIYARNPDRCWWMLLPSGCLATLGIVTTMTLLGVPRAAGLQLPVVFVYLGFAITLCIAWLHHHQAWAGFAAGLVAGLFLMQVVLDLQQVSWPLAVVAAGLYLLYKAVRSGRKKLAPGM